MTDHLNNLTIEVEIELRLERATESFRFYFNAITAPFVIPAQAGIHSALQGAPHLDFRDQGNDGFLRRFLVVLKWKLNYAAGAPDVPACQPRCRASRSQE